jgi:hypothetical protein
MTEQKKRSSEAIIQSVSLDLESFEMWCRRRMEKISQTYCVSNEEVLHRVKKERNILQTIRRRKANWIGHVFCRNCFLNHVLEEKTDGRTEVSRR